MRVVFVHGMRQEGKIAAELQTAWEEAMTGAWTKGGMARPTYSLEMPFYGDVLDGEIKKLRGGQVVARGDGTAGGLSPLEEELIREIAGNAGVTEADARVELGQEVVARGPANWEIVQALGRALERKIPGVGGLALRFVRQVDGYLTRPHITEAVDTIVGPTLLNGPTVVIAHSLGTVVAYRNLRKAGEAAKVPLFITLGSPLGIASVQRHLRPPSLKVPAGVAKWLNGTDERDPVALVSQLTRDTFADGIENLPDIRNRRDDAHLILDYLADSRVSQRIHAALG